MTSHVLVPLLLLTLLAGPHGELSDHGHHQHEPTGNGSAGPRASQEVRHSAPEVLPVSHTAGYEPFPYTPPDLTARNEAYANEIARENERESVFDALLLLPWAVVASQSRPSYGPPPVGADAAPAPGWSSYYFGTYRPGVGGGPYNWPN